uniref:Uncharacterized protein n=1 Tax=Arundo donax TaxID=35708 RepID=A0A0A8Y886_ARUDO
MRRNSGMKNKEEQASEKVEKMQILTVLDLSVLCSCVTFSYSHYT